MPTGMGERVWPTWRGAAEAGGGGGAAREGAGNRPGNSGRCRAAPRCGMRHEQVGQIRAASPDPLYQARMGMLSGRRLPPPLTRLRRRARRAVTARCGTNFPRHLGPTARRQLRRGPLRASSGRRTSAGAKHAERARERHRIARRYRQHRHARGRDRGIAGGGAGDREAGAGGGLSGGGARTREACALGARRGKAHAHLEVSRDHICFKHREHVLLHRACRVMPPSCRRQCFR